MARLPRKVREINDFNATDWFEKLLQRTTSMEKVAPLGVAFFVISVFNASIFRFFLLICLGMQ